MEKQNEDYVTYDVAQLLQQKGYNERTRKSYVTEDIPSFSLKEGYLVMGNYSIDGESKCIPAPTLAETAKWLRENYGMFVTVKPERNIVWDEDEEDTDEGIFWTYNVYSLEDIDNAISEWDRLSPYYEIALNEGIRDALKMI